MSKNSRLVYSTGVGRIKENEPDHDSQAPSAIHADGVVRIRRESKGRGGKVVSVVEGVPDAQQKAIGKILKARCATGGSIKNNVIEIQGDHRETIKLQLEKKGFTVKFSGG